MDHVLGKADTAEGCLFEPATSATSSKKYLMLHRDAMTIVLLNRFPYANGHLLVAPARHVDCLSALQPDEAYAVTTILQSCTTILKDHFACSGINIGCNIGESAGAGIADHLHFHLVPRWSGDHNFMTVLADIRTIPQHIEETFDQLLPRFKHLNQPLTYSR
ncbi:MAG: HIT domain-containing protein [Desulfopila sp.]|jgi:ATP adenylyltransferase|nr:HIT domain-containing protein [Desulfopila sp.]